MPPLEDVDRDIPESSYGFVTPSKDMIPPCTSNLAPTSDLSGTHVETIQRHVGRIQEDLSHNFIADSHDIAIQDHNVKGEIQKQPILPSAMDTKDLGWHRSRSDVPDTLIGGINNADLFSMIRRFNKDVFEVRAVPPRVMSGLDLTEAWGDDHATDKTTVHLQRAYLSIVLGLTSFGNQVSRLRSWNESRRTGIFCIIYFLAWSFNLLILLALGTLIVIVGSARVRNALFPPMPLALVNTRTGALQKPQSGQLGTTNTITGAPEKAPGEAREEEAANFVDNIRHIISHSLSLHDNMASQGNPLQGQVPSVVQSTIKSVRAAGAAPAYTTGNTGKDRTKKPMEELVWDQARPKIIDPLVKNFPHAIGEIVDNWERFANAVAPTPPFSQLSFLRIEGILGLLFLASLLISQSLINKGISFALGFSIFGDPVISRVLDILTEKFPTWRALLEPKNNILRGVPTNNQLTLTLLRIGEVHHSPIPPVPIVKETDPDIIPDIQKDQILLGASEQEVLQATKPSAMPNGSSDHFSSPDSKNEDEHASGDETAKPKHRHLSRVITFFKGNTKAAIETKLAVDHIRAAAGSKRAKSQLGILPKKKNLIYAGPLEFAARLEGKKGWLYITFLDADHRPTISSAVAEHYLIFTTDDPRGQHNKIDVSDKSKTPWLIAVCNIRRLKRATAFVSQPAEMAATWADNTDLLGSIEIEDEGGKTWRFTAIPERNALFNRLIAVGKQRWENM